MKPHTLSMVRLWKILTFLFVSIILICIVIITVNKVFLLKNPQMQSGSLGAIPTGTSLNPKYSLLAYVDIGKGIAAKQFSNPYLMEMHVSIDHINSDTPEIFGNYDYTSSQKMAKYLWYTPGDDSPHGTYFVPFAPRNCTAGTSHGVIGNTLTPTPAPYIENIALHPPITNWTVDIPQLRQIIQAYPQFTNYTSLSILVTSLVRQAQVNCNVHITIDDQKKLASLSQDTSVVWITFLLPSTGNKIKEGYIILTADGQKVLATNTVSYQNIAIMYHETLL